MKICYLILVLFLRPYVLFSQTEQDTIDLKSREEIYSIVQLVITDEKLDKKNGLAISPLQYLRVDYEDTTYLKTLLIAPKQIDTSKKINSSDPFDIFPFP